MMRVMNSRARFLLVSFAFAATALHARSAQGAAFLFRQTSRPLYNHRGETHLARGRRGGGDIEKAKPISKENLPSKFCVVCGRPFSWRKKWERCWDEVTTCSKRCNSERRGGSSSSMKED